jgi:hypothetical protein
MLVLGEKPLQIKSVRRCALPFMRRAAVVLDPAQEGDDATKPKLLVVVESLACPQNCHLFMISFGSDVHSRLHRIGPRRRILFYARYRRLGAKT